MPDETIEIGGEAVEPSSLARRFGALVVDWVLCLLIAKLFGNTVREWWLPNVVLIIEYAFFVGLFRQTPGMFVTRIRCVSITSGGAINVARAALRGLLLAVLVPALIMDSQRRGLHDKAVGSIVVNQVTRPKL